MHKVIVPPESLFPTQVVATSVREWAVISFTLAMCKP